MALMDGLKTAAEVLRAADKIPEMMQILEGMQNLLDLQEQLGVEKGKVARLQAEIDAIRADKISAEGIERKPDYYKLGEHPYCVHCWEVDKRLGSLIRAKKMTGSHTLTFLQCARCKQEVSPRGFI